MGADLRPDLSGILVNTVTDGIPSSCSGHLGITFEVLRTQAALRGRGVIEAIGGLITSNVATFLVVPGPPGFAGTRIFLNDQIHDLVERRDRDGMLAKLEEIFLFGMGTRKEWAG